MPSRWRERAHPAKSSLAILPSPAAMARCAPPACSPPALESGKVWHVSTRLDAESMGNAAQALVGQHDFTTFRAAECQAASPVKTLDRLDVSRRADEVHIEASARSFLH